MKATVQIVELVRNKAMSTEKETIKRLRVKRDGDIFMGITFSKEMPKDYTVTRIIDSKKSFGRVTDIMLDACAMLGRHDMLRDTTFRTMCYWQLLNGFSNVIVEAAYGVGNDDKRTFSHVPIKGSSERDLASAADTQSAA